MIQFDQRATKKSPVAFAKKPWTKVRPSPGPPPPSSQFEAKAIFVRFDPGV